jgi:predicted TIM-barrel fold metal-dependent hydrolase
VKNPSTGITFLIGEDGNPSRGKLEQIWKYVDWYSIICSLILQYPNVYADVSYILHDSAIQPLLKQTMLNPNLKKRILFGTDFYVVRNHKSEKNLLADMLTNLSEEEFSQMARSNPREFLENKLHGQITI